MNYVGWPNMFLQFDGGAAELRETLGIVGVVPRFFAVKTRPIKIRRIVQKKITYAANDGAIVDSGKTQAEPLGDGQTGHDHGAGFHVAIAGQKDSYFVAQFDQGAG